MRRLPRRRGIYRQAGGVVSDNTGTLWPDGWHLDACQLDALMTYTQRTGSTLEFEAT